MIQRIGCAALLILLTVYGWGWARRLVDAERLSKAPIRVGILRSQSGPLAAGERPLMEVTQMAFDELNAAGGVLGRPIELLQPDCASDPQEFARQAERLILEEHVDTLFGCWTSATRKMVLPVVERNDHLLYYPVLYEGLEISPNVLYLGAAPNQHILPGLRWSILTFGRRVYLVAPDYVYGHAANAIIRQQLERWRGDMVGEAYIRLQGDEDHVAAIVEDIQRQQPDVILTNLFGESYKALTLGLRQAGITPEIIPQMAFAMTERQLVELDALDAMAGDYAVANYFQSLPGEANRRFVESYRSRFGRQSVTDDFIEAHYSAVKLWALAVERAGSSDVAAIRQASVDVAFEGPSGLYYIDPETRHAWRRVYIGRMQSDGQVDIVWQSGRLIRPEPFPELQPRAVWEEHLQDLYRRWGRNWINTTDQPSAPGSSFTFRSASRAPTE